MERSTQQLYMQVAEVNDKGRSGKVCYIERAASPAVTPAVLFELGGISSFLLPVLPSSGYRRPASLLQFYFLAIAIRVGSFWFCC